MYTHMRVRGLVTSTKKKINRKQVDNFYLDMNGIIHMCTHANAEELILLDERKMFQRIFAYTDRLYKIVAPTRVRACVGTWDVWLVC